MTPRTGLYVALVGLVMAVLCYATFFLFGSFFVTLIGEPKPLSRYLAGGILLGVLLGLIVMVVGLVMAGVLALKKQSGKPS
jgi:Na+-driven multidrug efflux pump